MKNGSDHQKSSGADRGTLLCIGTSGMLASCTPRLIREGWRVHAIARDQSKLDLLGVDSDGSLTTSACDYQDLDAFERALDAAPKPVTAVLYWIHSSGQGAIELIETRYAGADLCRVVGSAHKITDTSETSARIVQLGFVIEDAASRWLTNDEISEGVYRAFVSGAQRMIVGTIEPWSSRP